MARDSKLSEVDPTVTEPGTVQTASPFQRMVRAMAMEASAEDDSRFTGDDLTSIIEAESEEELWDADERPPLNAQHLAGCILEILDVDVHYSRGSRDDIETPFQVSDGRSTKKMYLVATAVRITNDADRGNLIKLPKIGEVFTFNTSARYFTTKLWQFYTRGYINREAGIKLRCLVRETDLGDGTAVLKLRPAPDSVVTS